MPYPQATCEFAGLDGVIAGEFTLSPGITPSACTLTCVPQPEKELYGDLVISYGNKRLTFKECISHHPTLEYRQDLETGRVWRLTILDRRWRWQYGSITGRYNARLPSGEIDETVEKTPQELAELLLEEMGEFRYNVSMLPNEPRPRVAWDSVNPAKALATLCEQLGCIISLGLDDKVYIWPIGSGNPLPKLENMRYDPFPHKTRVRPRDIQVVGPPVKVQMRLQLTPVGLDNNDRIRALGDLSYKPDDGWEYEQPEFFLGVNADDRWYAFHSVWRWYKVSGLLGDATKIQGLDVDVNDMRQLFPLHETLIETATMLDDYEQSRRPYVEGEFWNRGLGTDTTAARTRYQGGFKLLRDDGIVVFDKPVYQYNSDGLIKPADIFLTAAFGVRPTVGELPIRYTRTRESGRSFGSIVNAGTEVYHRSDLLHTIEIEQMDGGMIQRLTDNINDVRARADEYLDEAVKKHLALPLGDVEYLGIEAIPITGLVRQVSWKWGVNEPSMTRASQNYEHDIYSPSDVARRRNEHVDAILEKTR